ncbi:MAG: sigma-70 family RNA polymerase sigma factor [Paramuribaculum sp.]|nr:sigma-70 family RNA polymerase sigma factor [Paramuribaculum sp.]
MNAQEFKSIVLPLSHDLYRFAAAILSDADKAADAVQDCMEALWIHRDRLQSATNRRAYCLTTLRNIACTCLRREPDTTSIEQLADDSLMESHNTDSSITEKYQAIQNIISELPEPAHTIILLSTYPDYTSADISEITGLSAVNVRAILSRTRKYLRKRLLSLY